MFGKETVMRKFTEILTLILALASIITAFTVVALAQESEEPTLTPVDETNANFNFDFESLATGYVISDYKFPYNFTVAKNGDTVYDSLSDAIGSAKAGETVVLTENAAELLIIDEAISVDANIYADGVPTGEYYTFDWASYNGYYLASESEGIYTFNLSEHTVTVNWDPECDTDCDCFVEAEGHSLNRTTLAIVGEVPSHPTNNPGFEVTADKRQAFFLGWSYDNDGIVDELVAVTDEQLAEGEITLYPVYEMKEYAIELSDAMENVIGYYVAGDLKTVIEGAATKSTVKLVRDIDTDCETIKINSSLTLDLNGYSIRRCFNYGNVYEATKDENGDFVYDATTPIDTIAISPDMFSVFNIDLTFTITSSVGGGNIYATNMHCDTWVYEGEVVKRTAKALSEYNTSTVGSRYLVYIGKDNNSKGLDLYINGGVSIFTGGLWYQDGPSHEGFKFYLTDVNFYRTSPYWTDSKASDQPDIMSSRTDMALEMHLTNCVINSQSYYKTTGTKLMHLGTNNHSASDTKVGNVIFTNCDILKNNGAHTYSIDNRRDKNLNLVFDNCRVYDMGSKGAINGTLQRAANDSGGMSITAAGDGFTNETVSIKKTYQLPVRTFTVDTTSDINAPSFNFKFNKTTFTFDRIATKAVNVNWVEADGNTIKTEQLRPGIDALEAPRSVIAVDDDAYRNIIAQWTDEDGRALTAKLGLLASSNNDIDWQDSYTFYAQESFNGVTNYIGGIKDVFFNISFTSSFRYNLYLPERDTNITFGDIPLFEKGELVKIYGKEYRAYSYIAGTAAAADNAEITLKFTVDGVEYEQLFKLNALLYADIVLLSSNIAEEKLAVGNMARFIMEARKATGLEVDEKRFNAILTAAGVEDYSAEYVGEGKINNLSTYILSVNYLIYNGAASYKFTLNGAAYADVLTFTLNGKEISYTVGTETIEEIEYTYLILDSAKVYDIIDTLTITVDGTELSATYSMLDNIEANPEENLLKALYEFGIAAENYRAYLQAL